MRAVIIAAVLALGNVAVAQTPPVATGTTPQPPPPNQAPPSDAPRLNAPGACTVDRDCPGALFCVSGQCVAQSPTGATKGDQVKVTPAKPAQKETQFGLSIDAGIPDGVALGFLYRPVHFLRFGAAAAYNGVGFGGRGMVLIAPFNFFITPTLSVEAGHFVAADATPLIAQALPQVAADPNFATFAPLLQEVSYDFANAHLGLEIGSPQHFIFFLRAGGSYIRSTIANFGQVVGATAPPELELEVADLNVRVIAPSLKLGLAAFF